MSLDVEDARRLRASIHVIGSLLDAEKPPQSSAATEHLWKNALLEGARSARASVPLKKCLRVLVCVTRFGAAKLLLRHLRMVKSNRFLKCLTPVVKLFDLGLAEISLYRVSTPPGEEDTSKECLRTPFFISSKQRPKDLHLKSDLPRGPSFQLASASQRQVRHLQQEPPLCFRFVQRVYHEYGLKHLILIFVLLFYTFFGAFLFLVIEGPTQKRMKDNISRNRSVFVTSLMSELFNNSDYLVYIKGRTTNRIEEHLLQSFQRYETQLDIRWSDQKMEWDYWNAILFAGTICTTIGYGHIYPITTPGRLLTVVYALGGIPLVLLVLQDLGKLLTVGMKYPWYQFKRFIRRILRIFTKQSLSDMAAIEYRERTDLCVFDVPLPAAISLILVWIWLCSTVISYWGSNWTFVETCYFFFISLSTIGLGDLVPHNPHLLLMMFGFILVGLSLVSMVLNLLQNKMRSTYEGRHSDGARRSSILDATTLGILQCFEERTKMEEKLRRCATRSAQTTLCLPVARQLILTEDGVQWIPHGSYSAYTLKSPDEVTALVEMRADVTVLSALGENEDEHDDSSASLLSEEFSAETPTILPPFLFQC
uniref:TWiK family of potassium channels protein 7 n=1 Tax=Steinernema glaseri TaxID=37863 RepID=A0A1I8AMK7_9BILA